MFKVFFVKFIYYVIELLRDTIESYDFLGNFFREIDGSSKSSENKTLDTTHSVEMTEIYSHSLYFGKNFVKPTYIY